MIVSVCGRYGLRVRWLTPPAGGVQITSLMLSGLGISFDWVKCRRSLLRLDYRRVINCAPTWRFTAVRVMSAGSPSSGATWLGHLLRLAPRPITDLADLVHQLVEHLRMPLRVSPGGE